jgi:hypothetical protein
LARRLFDKAVGREVGKENVRLARQLTSGGGWGPGREVDRVRGWKGGRLGGEGQRLFVRTVSRTVVC